MINAKTIKKTALAPTVLISHGGGFLTAHLAQTLLLKNCRVVVLTKFSEHKDAHLAQLLKNPKFALFDCDISVELPQAIESVDYIFHLSNYDLFVGVDQEPDLEALLSAGVGTKHLLDLAKKSQAKFALVCPVTSKLKSRPIDWVQNADVSADEAQKYSQSLTLQYRDRYQLDARFLYLGQVYGTNMDLKNSGELGSLISDVLEGKTLRVFGDGARKEFYTFYTDAVSGLVKGLFSSTPYGSYTLVEQKPHTTLEVAYLLRSLALGTLDLEFVQSDRVYLDPVLEEISYPPSWSLKVELKDGLVKTLKSFGYKPNTKAFKAGILIDEKFANTSISNEPIKETTISPAPNYKQPDINPIKLAWYRTEKRIRTFLKTLSYAEKEKVKVLSGIKLFAGAVLSLFSVTGVLVGVPIVQSYTHAKGALAELENYKISIAQMDVQKSLKSSENAYNHLAKLQNALSRGKFFFDLLGRGEMLNSSLAFCESAKNFSLGLYNLSLGVEPFSRLWEGFKPNSKVSYNSHDFKLASSNFLEAKEKLELAKAALSSVNSSVLPTFVRDDFAKYKGFLESLTDNSDFLTQLALEFPSILGLDKEKRYLILFQNNNEIRPTGGFLGSYADIKIKDGKITSINIDDIYNPDGELKLSGANLSFKSPPPIARLLGEENLYIRNANWDPSFPQSANTISNLFNLVDGRTYDAVFAVDLYFVRDLLSVTGPVYLTAYEEEIRVENMYERAQFHSDFNFEEGNSAKKAFLTVLGSKILEKLFSLPQEKIGALGNVLYSSLEQKHLLVYFASGYLNNYLADKGWDGGILNSDGDYLYVINANLGGTKSNYYVKNDMNYVVSSKTSDGLLRAELELTYENTQKDASWPGGPYINYVRVLVPNGSKLTGAFLMGGLEEAELAKKAKEEAVEGSSTKNESSDSAVSKNNNDSSVQGASTGTSIFEDVVISKVGKYTSFEYKVKVYPQEKVKLLFTYDLPQSMSAKKGENLYKLVWQKQPGTQNDSVRFMFVAPFGTNIVRTTQKGLISENSYEYKGLLNSDLRLELNYK